MQEQNILQYESKIWETANTLYAAGFKLSDAPKFMMPFFALAMIESRLIRMHENLKEEFGDEVLSTTSKEDLIEIIQDRGQGYNTYIFENNKRLLDICQNDTSFEIDFFEYLNGFDPETKELLGVNPSDGVVYLDIKGISQKLKAKNRLFSFVKGWASVDLKPFNNSEITTLEEHIKRKWADMSAETAGQHYTPDDVISLISEIVASKIEESDKLLKIYDCTCGGGNLLFGVEDRINEKFSRLTQTFGQDWEDSLYALAKIESRFREDSKIEHGDTLSDDRFSNEEFDVIIANPPYGVSWKDNKKNIEHDKTGRYKFLPSVSDGQFLFMQHLISKFSPLGAVGVVVANGSTLFSGDAGSAESNTRKWMLDTDIVEAIIQLPTDEFFNTGIYTYLWVLNKNKDAKRKDKVMLINASEKFKPLKKSKGSKRKEVDKLSRQDIVEALTTFDDNDYSRVFDKEFFYFNKQAIQLTNVDENEVSFEDKLNGKKSLKLKPILIETGKGNIEEFEIFDYNENKFDSLKACFNDYWKPFLTSLDYKTQDIRIDTLDGKHYEYGDVDETIFCDLEPLGNGKFIIKGSYKKTTRTKAEHVAITVELTADYQKDYEIIPFHRDEEKNQDAITSFMKKYISKPFVYLDNVVGVEINFNKVFYKPEKLRSVTDIMSDLTSLESELVDLEKGLVL